MESLKNKIISYIYTISTQPVKLSEFLSANSLFNEGMHLDGKKLGFRLRTGRAYLVFLGFANLIMVPLALITHEIFKSVDCHISIILTAVVTGVIFASFGLFKDWLSDAVASKRIQMMWKLHFPHFDYENYNKKVTDIYHQALKEDIAKKDLERYIIENLTK